MLRGHSASVDLTTVIFTVFAFGWLILPLIVVRPGQHPGPRHAGALPAAHPPAGGRPAGRLGHRRLAAGQPDRPARGDRRAGPRRARPARRGGRGGCCEVLFCITLARFVTTGLAGLLRSRRGKDFAAFLIIPIFALYEFFTQVVPKLTAEGKLTAASFAGVDAWMRWLPPGLAAHAIQDASDGHPGTALLRLALLAAVIVVLGWLWIRSLGRGPGDRRHHHAVSGGARRGAAARPVRPARRGGRPVLDLPAPRTHLADLLGHHRGHHGGRVDQHHPDPDRITADCSSARCFGAAFVGVFHANSIGLTRTGLRPGGDGAERPPRAAGLLLRPEPRARRDRGAAAHRGLLRPGGRGRASGGRIPRHGGGPGRDRRGLALANIFTAALPYPVEKRAGSPGAQARRRIHGLLGRGNFRRPDRRGAGGPPGDHRRGAHRHSAPAGGPDAGARGCAPPCYGLALAWIGVQIAARMAEPKLPELYQIALQSKL